jgi:hypothetical protein
MNLIFEDGEDEHDEEHGETCVIDESHCFILFLV